MSEFLLVIVDHNFFKICKAGQEHPADLIVGRRDPDQPIAWKIGNFYFNPLYDHRNVFVYREDQKLVTLNGSPASKISSQGQNARTWFEVIPQPINMGSVPRELRNMIVSLPTQVKIVSQAVMQHLGIRVPNDFEPKEADDWFKALTSLQVPLGPDFKVALASSLSNRVTINKEVQLEFETGRVTPPGVTVQIRMFQIVEKVKRVRQIRDSVYVSVHLPIEIINAGPEAVAIWIERHSEIAKKFSLENEPISETVLEEEQVKEGPVELVGWRRRDPSYKWEKLWGQDARTVNDTMREILGERDGSRIY